MASSASAPWRGKNAEHVIMSGYTVVVEAQNLLGEGPAWVAQENAVYWVDILGHRLHRHSLVDRTTTDWSMPEPICWLVERRDAPGFMAGFASGFAPLSLNPVQIGPIRQIGLARVDHRLNDAKVDPAGRLWAGKMPFAGDTPSGGFYRISGDGDPVCVEDGYIVPNGPAFSPSGEYLYHADSAQRVVYRYGLGADGELTDRRDHIVFCEDWGYPDGMTVDAEGYLWVAHWDGGRVSRFDPDGLFDRAITLPASRITSCVFGGKALDRLFVTSSRKDREDEPLAGALFEIVPGTTGIAPAKFAG